MIKLKINNTHYTVEKGLNLMETIRQCGISVPSMCYLKGIEHFTSCMICVVKDLKAGKLIPSCSVKVIDGMELETQSDEISEFRFTTLNLLLSEHLGDCEAPCTIACPAGMDIPEMNRLLAKNKVDEALTLVKNDIILPSVLGRICPAPCEGACKRKTIDDPVNICVLKRFAGDEGKHVVSSIPIVSDKKVAVIGSGPAGLAAAYHLRQNGIYACVYDKNEKPGGQLRYAINDELLPKNVLDKEIDFIIASGVDILSNKSIDKSAFEEIKSNYDAVIIAAGAKSSDIFDPDLQSDDKGIVINKASFETSIPGVFAVGNAVRESKYAIRALGQGKDVAKIVSNFVLNGNKAPLHKVFNSRLGKLIKEEYDEYLKESNTGKRINKDSGEGFSLDDVIKEASRCLNCDCRKKDACKLRDLSDEYKAKQNTYQYGERKQVTKQFNHDLVVYEPGKCIKCGICVRLTALHKEEFGLTFIGRGFDVEIGVPFYTELKKGLKEVALQVAQECPTGAIAIKNN
ncbi:2Fe-2S iron-sulfur cluster-binding protein [Bacteroidales bacterium]|nr:2Fe-2S iron-sulfur cluster-binding protein [Bacteroidales bacterium]